MGARLERHLIRSDAELHRIRADDERARFSDGDGLYLLLKVKGGGRAWRFDYTHDGKRKTISLGTFPEVSLSEARRRRNDAQALLVAGKDPAAERKREREEVQRIAVVERRTEKGLPIPGTFGFVFEEWHKTRSSGWSDSYAEKTHARITNDILPWLGDKPIGDITEKDLLECLRRVQARGAIESAHSTMQNCGQIFRFGVASGECSRNPAQGMSEALKPVIVKHMAAITDPDEFAALLQSIGEYKGSILTKTALLLLAMTFQRPANVRGMRWEDLDLQAGMWTIPSALMKRTVQQKVSGKPHLVPLCREAVALLREVEPLTKPHGDWVFPSLQGRGKCMSENTLNHALRRLGIQHHAMVSHGFRASARTLLVERLGVDENVVEAQLAHAKRGPLGSAYDRTQFIDARVMLMHQWGRVVLDCARGADFPDELPAVDVGVKVAPKRQNRNRVQ